MPRTERPLESELGRFAAELRKLRDEAGKPSYRALLHARITRRRRCPTRPVAGIS